MEWQQRLCNMNLDGHFWMSAKRGGKCYRFENSFRVWRKILGRRLPGWRLSAKCDPPNSSPSWHHQMAFSIWLSAVHVQPLLLKYLNFSQHPVPLTSAVTLTAHVGKRITRNLPSPAHFLVIVGLCTGCCWGLDITMQSADIISRTAYTHLLTVISLFCAIS